MNRDQVLLHLSEAGYAIAKTIRDLREDPEYGDAEYWVDVQHIYHHLNTAWNSRAASKSQIASATDADFNRWNAFPRDFPMMEVHDGKEA